MFIEDIIRKTSSISFFSFTNPSVVYTRNLIGRELQMLDSMCEQLDRGTQLTEKQALVILRILKKCKDELRPEIPNIDDVLDNPTWKSPFRILSTDRKIGIDKKETPIISNQEKCIYVKFPFDQEIVETFRKRNPTVNDIHRGSWNNDSGRWEFSLTEKNLLWLGDYLKNFNFEIEEEFTDLYDAADQVRSSIEDHLPMLTLVDDKYKIVNLPAAIDEITTTNLTEALFFARSHGVTSWDDVIDKKITQEVNLHTKQILESTIRNRPWINSEEVSIGEFATDLLNYSNKILIVIPGGSEYKLTKKWVEFANNIGIESKNMSVMFRLPNDQSEFNQFVKESELNNPVDEDTKIVFVNTKITKPLVKSNISFDAVINLGYYNYMHFTMETVVENAPILVYYNIKEPAKTRKWLPQEL
jgi:hypothetical protein